MRTFLAAGAVAALALSAAAADLDLKGKTLQQTFTELLPGLGTQAPQQQWQNVCFQLGAPGREAQRFEACTLMAAKLDAGTPKATRLWLLKQLERIGRAESVEATAVLLADPDEQLRDAAVRCLANNPAPTATARLTAAVPAAAGKARVGLLNALGRRNDPAAVAVFVKELSNADPAIASAAAAALGQLATPEATKELAAARTKAQGAARQAISDAYLRCADRRLRDGQTAAAAAIYQELNKADETPATRLAALQGVLRTAGDQAGPLVLAILGGTDAGARAIAVGQIEALSAGALKPLAANIDKLPVPSQLLVLNAIAARGDRSQLPVALAATKSSNASIQRAGILALGKLGDDAVVPQLVETVFAGGTLGGAAADSLAQLSSDGVNAKLIAALEAEKAPARMTALIAVLERRKASAAVPALLRAAQGDDAGVRISAFNGLKALAEPKHLPAMVLALLKTTRGKERDTAELAIVAVCGQVADPAQRAQPVLALLQDGAKGQKQALLPLLGRLGGPQALPVVKEALTSSDPELSEAAAVSLCLWPDAAVSDDLLKLVQNGKELAQRQRALAALIRVNTIVAADKTNDERLASLAALKKAMGLATTDEERRAILEGIGFVRHLDTFHYVLPYLDSKELEQAACKAVVELAHSKTLREPNKPEFDKALTRVIAMCKDKTLVERARQYKLGQ